MAKTHHHANDDFLNDLPPPAYELSSTELDRKIADATQRSLALQEEQLQRPSLPPLDEDGFPAWSEEFFNYNVALRQREEEARSAKLQSEYTRPAVPSSSPGGSSSTSPPPPHSQSVSGSGGLSSKQKEGHFGWLDNNVQGIAQDEDDEPAGTESLNVGRPPSMTYPAPPRTQNQSHPHPRPGIQVQVGPRPHDVLAQPQSPVSDIDEDDPLSSAAAKSNLGRAPTYYPMGQTHPVHEQQLRRQSTRSSVGSTRSELPAWSALAPSLEGPAYEEVAQGSGPRASQVPSRVASPIVGGGGRRSTSPEERRHTVDWRPVQARPQVQERVRRSTSAMPHAGGGGVPYGSPSPQPRVPSAGATLNAPPAAASPAQTWASSPNVHTPSPSTTYTPSLPTPHIPPGGYNPPGAGMRLGGFDPGVAYRSTQRPTLAGRVDSSSMGGIVEAQNALREGGASAFYNTAVAATMHKTTPVFKAPPPPPQRTDDDNLSMFSGMSGGRQGSVHSGGAGARMSVYSGNGAEATNRTSYVPPLPTGGPTYQSWTGTGGVSNAPMFAVPPPPPGAQSGYAPGAQPAYAPGSQQMASRPLPNAPGFAPHPGAGGYVAPPPNAGGFVAPPPPPGAAPPAPVGPGGFVQPGRKLGKLYKRL